MLPQQDMLLASGGTGKTQGEEALRRTRGNSIAFSIREKQSQ